LNDVNTKHKQQIRDDKSRGLVKKREGVSDFKAPSSGMMPLMATPLQLLPVDMIPYNPVKLKCKRYQHRMWHA
jgi:hypothetical protein